MASCNPSPPGDLLVTLVASVWWGTAAGVQTGPGEVQLHGHHLHAHRRPAYESSPVENWVLD